MLKIILFICTLTFVSLEDHPCAYWCEASCTKKVIAFYCCSVEPSLKGPSKFLPPPCTDLCVHRAGNNFQHLRNCSKEMEEMKALGAFQFCTNFMDCNPELHDLCCTDNCLPPNKKMCVKLQ